MKWTPAGPGSPNPFDIVTGIGLSLPGVEVATKYDGSPVLELDGCFIAGVAAHPSAERHTMVVRCDLEERELLLQDAPDVYYLTEYYRPHPVVLVRLSLVDRGALSDLLSVSCRLTRAKGRRRRNRGGR
jgi:hypothetical protein